MLLKIGLVFMFCAVLSTGQGSGKVLFRFHVACRPALTWILLPFLLLPHLLDMCATHKVVGLSVFFSQTEQNFNRCRCM